MAHPITRTLHAAGIATTLVDEENLEWRTHDDYAIITCDPNSEGNFILSLWAQDHASWELPFKADEISNIISILKRISLQQG